MYAKKFHPHKKRDPVNHWNIHVICGMAASFVRSDRQPASQPAIRSTYRSVGRSFVWYLWIGWLFTVINIIFYIENNKHRPSIGSDAVAQQLLHNRPAADVKDLGYQNKHLPVKSWLVGVCVVPFSVKRRLRMQ